MKKLIYLLFLLPLAMLASCHDDDDLPNVDITVTFDNVVANDQGVIYVVQGEELDVQSVTCVGLGGKNAAVTSVQYTWNGQVLQWNPFAPYKIEIDTSYALVGNHSLTLYMDVAQVDKTLAYSVISIPVVVVATADELPGGAAPGVVSQTYNVGQKDKK